MPKDAIGLSTARYLQMTKGLSRDQILQQFDIEDDSANPDTPDGLKQPKLVPGTVAYQAAQKPSEHQPLFETGLLDRIGKFGQGMKEATIGGLSEMGKATESEFQAHPLATAMFPFLPGAMATGKAIKQGVAQRATDLGESLDNPNLTTGQKVLRTIGDTSAILSAPVGGTAIADASDLIATEPERAFGQLAGYGLMAAAPTAVKIARRNSVPIGRSFLRRGANVAADAFSLKRGDVRREMIGLNQEKVPAGPIATKLDQGDLPSLSRERLLGNLEENVDKYGNKVQTFKNNIARGEVTMPADEVINGLRKKALDYAARDPVTGKIKIDPRTRRPIGMTPENTATINNLYDKMRQITNPRTGIVGPDGLIDFVDLDRELGHLDKSVYEHIKSTNSLAAESPAFAKERTGNLMRNAKHERLPDLAEADKRFSANTKLRDWFENHVGERTTLIGKFFNTDPRIIRGGVYTLAATSGFGPIGLAAKAVAAVEAVHQLITSTPVRTMRAQTYWTIGKLLQRGDIVGAGEAARAALAGAGSTGEGGAGRTSNTTSPPNSPAGGAGGVGGGGVPPGTGSGGGPVSTAGSANALPTRLSYYRRLLSEAEAGGNQKAAATIRQQIADLEAQTTDLVPAPRGLSTELKSPERQRGALPERPYPVPGEIAYPPVTDALRGSQYGVDPLAQSALPERGTTPPVTGLPERQKLLTTSELPPQGPFSPYPPPPTPYDALKPGYFDPAREAGMYAPPFESPTVARLEALKKALNRNEVRKLRKGVGISESAESGTTNQKVAAKTTSKEKTSTATSANPTAQTSLSPDTVTKLKQKLAGGMDVWRGERGPDVAPADPGDFGQGAYHSTASSRAKQYGKLTKAKVQLKNPLVLTKAEAYSLVADKYGTISGTAGKPQGGAGEFSARTQRAAEATADLRKQGYDGIAAVDPRGEIEIVAFPQETMPSREAAAAKVEGETTNQPLPSREQAEAEVKQTFAKLNEEAAKREAERNGKYIITKQERAAKGAGETTNTTPAEPAKTTPEPKPGSVDLKTEVDRAVKETEAERGTKPTPPATPPATPPNPRDRIALLRKSAEIQKRKGNIMGYNRIMSQADRLADHIRFEEAKKAGKNTVNFKQATALMDATPSEPSTKLANKKLGIPEGTNVDVEHGKDGTVTHTWTKPDGSVVHRIERPDGTSTVVQGEQAIPNRKASEKKLAEGGLTERKVSDIPGAEVVGQIKPEPVKSAFAEGDSVEATRQGTRYHGRVAKIYKGPQGDTYIDVAVRTARKQLKGGKLSPRESLVEGTHTFREQDVFPRK